MTLNEFKDKFAATLITLALSSGIGLSTSITTLAQHPNLGGSIELRQTALKAGANAGLKAGREDRKKGRAHEFQDEIEFLKASKDYNAKLGDLGLYKIYFRQAFANAYGAGYSGD